MDLYKGPDMHSKISDSHPDFKATGLSKECFADGNENHSRTD
jgi:hypothetical protein